MSRDKMIDWLVNPDGSPGQTHNIVKGCDGPDGDGKHCAYCYAKNMVKRFKYAKDIARMEMENKLKKGNIEIKDFPWKKTRLTDRVKNFKPTFFDYVLEQKLRKKPTMYFFSMSDPADWKEEWYDKIVKKIERYPQHTFVILTKRPEIYEKYIFPGNCWIGITVTNNDEWNKISFLTELSLKNKTFISFEPLYECIEDSIFDNIITGDWSHYGEEDGEVCRHYGKPVDWVIVGPERGKILDREILLPFFNLDVPVFMKESCKKSLYEGEALRKDWPEGYLNE